MKKIVSFSLFGNNPLYCIGMIENLKLMNEIYPNWTMRIYYSNDVPVNYINEAKKYNCELVLKERKNVYDGTLWRFLPLLDNNVDLWISRDCDSRINYRELACVNEWIESNKCLHIMRDSIYHNDVIQAGMFGINNNLIKKYNIDFEKILFANYNFNNKNIDQIVLKNTIWKLLLNDHIAHDIQGQRWKNDNNIVKNFPKHLPIKYGLYVGQIILEDNTIKRYKHVEEEYQSRGVKY